jgi:hypothetical protein
MRRPVLVPASVLTCILLVSSCDTQTWRGPLALLTDSATGTGRAPIACGETIEFTAAEEARAPMRLPRRFCNARSADTVVDLMVGRKDTVLGVSRFWKPDRLRATQDSLARLFSQRYGTPLVCVPYTSSGVQLTTLQWRTEGMLIELGSTELGELAWGVYLPPRACHTAGT